MIPVAFLASVILFLLLKLTPGDPVLIILGERATAENYHALRKDLGLDDPYPVQYAPGSSGDVTDTAPEWFRRLLVLGSALSSFGPATQTRFIRSGLLDTLHQDYIRTARAKGFGETSVILRHALRNALIPSVTFLGLQFGGILEGAFIVESVFAWPGIGRLGFQALGARDYPTVQAVVLLAVFLFLIANLVVDIAYAYLDPRISYRGGRRYKSSQPAKRPPPPTTPTDAPPTPPR